jgi:small subunit ribosomal protein S6
MENKHYETTFVFFADLSAEETEAIVAKYVTLLKEKNAEIVHQYDIEHRKLAYPIQKRLDAQYQTIEFATKSSIIPALELRYKHDEKILRFLTVHLDKKGIAYKAEQRKNIAVEKKENLN